MNQFNADLMKYFANHLSILNQALRQLYDNDLKYNIILVIFECFLIQLCIEMLSYNFSNFTV